MSNFEEWQETRELLVSAFDPGQLREGANQLVGQVGVLFRIWEPHPDGLPFLAPQV